jgi:UDP-glucose 6-dehydrogenase
MRAQAQELVKLVKGLKVEINKIDDLRNNRFPITDEVDLYVNDAKDYVHVTFNKGGKQVDVTIHDFNETHYSETLNIDLSIIDHELDKIVKRSKNIVIIFTTVYKNWAEEIKEKKIEELETQIAKLRGDVSA